MRSSRWWRASLGIVVAMSFPLSATSAAPGAAAAGSSVVVQPGDSWVSVRDRLFPLEALRRANPGLDHEILHPGDVVRAPYVPVSTVDSERAARDAAESRAIAAKARLAELEKDRAAFDAQRRELEHAESALSSMHGLAIGLGVVMVVCSALLVLVANATYASRRKATDAVTRYSTLHKQYEGLRQALHEIDVRVQQRVVSLLQLHGAKVVTDAELRSSMGHVLEFADELKTKYKAS